MNSGGFWLFLHSDGVSAVLPASGGWDLPILCFVYVLAIFGFFWILMV